MDKPFVEQRQVLAQNRQASGTSSLLLDCPGRALTPSQANDIQNIVKSNPTVGFTLILQLTGVHGSHQFDKLTKTKTVETILTNMDRDGIQSYIEYLLNLVNDEQGAKG